MTLRPITESEFNEADERGSDATLFQPGDEILRWRWLSLALPPSLYIAAATPRELVPPTRVRVLDPSIAPAGHVALLHAHLGAMMPFETLWSELGARLLRGEIGELQSRMSRDNPLRETDGRRWLECLRKAFIVREFLFRHAGHSDVLGACSRCRLPSPWRNVLYHFARDPRETSAPVRVRAPSRWDSEQREICFLRDAFHHSRDEFGPYRRLFIQYLRAKVLLYRHLVADADSFGLLSFKNAQRRISRYSLPPSGTQLKRQLDREIGLMMRCAEIRTTPGNWLRTRDGVKPVSDDAIESAWILHFSRSSGVTSAGTKANHVVRSAVRTRAIEARTLASVIHARPYVLNRVRGLDVAGLEHEGPLWAFLSHLKSTRITSKLAATRYGRRLEPLRLTIHVGEDFEHLASGLRAVHEPFAWRIVERGDRLGHALALGIEPRQWLQRLQTEGWRGFEMRPWDRLLDIGWLYHAFRRFGLGLPVHDLERLGREALGLLGRLGWGTHPEGHPVSRYDAPAVAESLWLGLGLDGDSPLRSRIAALRERVPLHMLDPRHAVAVDVDVHLLELVRQPIAKLVAKSGVAIEINPTSNMIIAGLPNPLEQPMFQLRATDPTKPQALSVVISTDDPLTFATCLSDEFAYAWAGMVLGCDMPPNYARAWLEDAAATSMRMRFTVPSLEKHNELRAPRRGRHD